MASADQHADPEEIVRDAGASTDQYVTGSTETGDFLTDKAPASDTPANGSSNAGVNSTRANRVDVEDDDEAPADRA
jgi:hypothetical protein